MGYPSHRGLLNYFGKTDDPMGRRITHAKLVAALTVSSGIQTIAATAIGCGTSIVSQRVAESEELQQIVDDGFKIIRDKAQQNILAAMDSLDERIRVDTSKWVAARLDKSKWTERTELTGAGGDVLFNVTIGPTV